MIKDTANLNTRDHTPEEARIFDRRLVRQRRERASGTFDRFNFLAEEVAERLIERLYDINRRFSSILVMGDPGAVLGSKLVRHYSPDFLVRTDLAAGPAGRGAGFHIAASEELIPFREKSFDLVISNLSLHWVNDLPGALVQIREILKPDGLFLAGLYGGGTLAELRESLARAEIEISGGLSARVSPFLDIRDAGGLLQRAGFAMPVSDSDTIKVTYYTAFDLMRDLRGMGETNALIARQKTPARRCLFIRAAENYAALHGLPNGRIPASFTCLFLTGWAPDASQPKPLRPGSAKARLADALKVPEVRLPGDI